MTSTSSTAEAPKVILFATDLSGRSDRALDRSAQLARIWGARLVVLHVIERKDSVFDQIKSADSPTWRPSQDRAAVVMHQVRRDLNETMGRADELPEMQVRIEEGDPVAKIDEVARTISADLIVTGVARNDTWGRQILGTTVPRLARRMSAPVLVVKNRVRPYRVILVATDFSASSRHALSAALAFFPDIQKTLFHAYEVPFPALLDKGNAREEFRAMEQKASDQFLDECKVSPEARRNLRTLIEHGVPAQAIRSYMEGSDADLVVLSTHGRSATFNALIGSTASRILETAPGDVLMIREPQSVQPAFQNV